MPTPAQLNSIYSTAGEISSFYTDKVGQVWVTAYGAVGDGVTDDTISVQLAVNAAVTAGTGEVYFTSGKTYKITALTSTTGITFLGNNVTITGGSTITVNSLTLHMADNAEIQINVKYPPASLAAVTLNGVTDDTTALLAQIAYLKSNKGGTLIFPVFETCVISNTIEIDTSEISLIGVSTERINDNGLLTGKRCEFLWNGAVGGTMFRFTARNDVAYTKTSNCHFENFMLNGQGTAGIGLDLLSITNCYFENLSLQRCTNVYMNLDTVENTAADQGDTNANHFENIKIKANAVDGGGVPIKMDGTGDGNTSFNLFEMIAINIYNNNGIVMNDCDNNIFRSVTIYRSAGGTGIGVELNATARANYFHQLSPGDSGVTARAGSYRNVIEFYDTENGADIPIIETGAQLYCSSQLMNTHFANLLKNGMFESWSGGDSVAPDDWTAARTALAKESTIKSRGNYSAKITSDGTYSYLESKIVIVDNGITVGDTITVTASIRAETTNDKNNKMQMYFRNSDDSTTYLELSTDVFDKTGVFKDYTSSGIVPNGTHHITVRFYINPSAVSDTDDVVYVDCIECMISPSFVVYTKHPNDEHLKALDYKNGATSYKYGLQRQQCGTDAIANGQSTLAITFPTAFAKILCVMITPIDVAEVIRSASVSVSGFTATRVGTTGANNFYWTAIGVL